ncbi:MAG: hypothetical protein ACRYG7_08565 [Janthinobacterium lividum]
MFSFFRSSRGLVLGLALLVLAAAVYFLRRRPAFPTATGPAYDLVFGVNIFDPTLQTTLVLTPYVLQDTLYLQAEQVASPVSTRCDLYRYHSQTGLTEALPLPSATEWHAQAEPRQFVLQATKGLRLDSNNTSPDGYCLTAPEWVEVNPVSNFFGNIVLFSLSGKFEHLKEREQNPRLTKDTVSVPIRANRPLFGNEGDNAFLLGWIVTAGPSNERAKR